MGRDWKKWAEEKGIRKWFRRDNFIVLVLTGILLVIIALPTGGGTEKEKEGGEFGGTDNIVSFSGTASGRQETDENTEAAGEEVYAEIFP